MGFRLGKAIGMNRYMIRVLMNDAEWGHYNELAAALQAFGIVDVIEAEDGAWYELPPAEYTYVGAATPEQVRHTVASTVSLIRPGFQVVVSQCSRVVWQGLQRVSPARRIA